MTYEAIQSLSGMAGLFIFLAMFVLVVAYVFWPSNTECFERARLVPLENDPLQGSEER